MVIFKKFFGLIQIILTTNFMFADLNSIPINNEISNEQPTQNSDKPQIQFTLKDTPSETKTSPKETIDNQFWPNTFSYLYLRNKPIPDVIKDFCKMQDIDVVVSDALLKNQQKVHQSFEKVLPVEIWKQISKSCGLMWFFDGHILYVYESSEIITKILKVYPLQIDPLMSLIEKLNFYGSNMAITPMREGGIIVLSGAPKMVELIESMTTNIEFYKNLDSDVLDVRIFPLKHAWADDKNIGNLTIPGIATMLNEILGKTLENEKSNRPVSTQNSAQRIKSIKDNEKNDEKNDETPQTILPEGGLITSDARQNAIIVKDYSKNLPLYEQIIQSLDVPLELIEIQAAIVNVSKDCGLTIGNNQISFKSIKHPNHEIKFQPLGSKPDEERFTGSFKGVINGNEFLNSINFLEKKNHSKVLARPSVITMNNLTAVMDQSETYYLPVKGHEGGDLYSISGSIKLQVTPHLIKENNINKIQLILDIKDEQVTPSSGEGSQNRVNSSSISTQAIVCEGQSVLVGGYFNESFVKGNAGVPILKDIPFIGYIFKNTTRNKETSERLFLITPRIIHLSSGENDYEGLFQTPSTLLNKDERIPMEFVHKDALTPEEMDDTHEDDDEDDDEDLHNIYINRDEDEDEDDIDEEDDDIDDENYIDDDYIDIDDDNEEPSGKSRRTKILFEKYSRNDQ